jgi:hypothetical protein
METNVKELGMKPEIERFLHNLPAEIQKLGLTAGHSSGGDNIAITGDIVINVYLNVDFGSIINSSVQQGNHINERR